MYTEQHLREACKKAFEQGRIVEAADSALYYGPECGIEFTDEEREFERALIVEFKDWFEFIDKDYLITEQPEEKYINENECGNCNRDIGSNPELHECQF